jgi:hypothetical protein
VVNNYIVSSGSPTQGSFINAYKSEEMDDFVVDDYHGRIARGEIINNPCVYTVEEVSEPDGLVTSYKPPYTGTSVKVEQSGPMTAYFMQNASLGLTDLSPPDVNQAREDVSKMRALAAIDSTPYAFGEDTLELRETFRFLKNPIKGLYDLSVGFRRDKRKLVRRLGRKTSDVLNYNKLLKTSEIYLQFQFAAMPLVRSCSDALEAYNTKEKTLPTRLTARGWDTAEGETSDSVVSSTGHHFDRSSTRRHEIKSSVLYEVSNPVRDWKWRYGFRRKDVPTTLWQVFPLSFMVDRMLDISSFSKGVMNLTDPNVKILSACVRTKSTLTYNVKYTGYTTTALWSATGSGGTRTQTNFVYDRATWSPSMFDTLPAFKPLGLVEDASKIADLVALIIGNTMSFQSERDFLPRKSVKVFTGLNYNLET